MLLLKGKYPSYKIEIDTYLDSLDIATSSDISAAKIYDAIRDLAEVNKNLKKLYREALFGSNKDVKARIKSRISNFRRNFR